MASGVYLIRCTSTGHRYVGSAENLDKRWQDHKRLLRREKHSNKALQYAWNLFGEASFEVETLEEVPTEALAERERHYVVTLSPEFNAVPVAGRAPAKEKKVVTTIRLGAGTSSMLRNFCHALSKTQTEVVEEALDNYFAKWNYNPKRYVLKVHQGRVILLENRGQDTKVLVIEERNGTSLEDLRLRFVKQYQVPIEIEVEGDQP
jgi:group I intron endonuclease